MNRVTPNVSDFSELMEKLEIVVINDLREAPPLPEHLNAIKLNAAQDEPEARQILRDNEVEEGYQCNVSVCDLTKFVDYPPTLEERLADLFFDDSEEIHYVKTLIAKAIFFRDPIQPSEPNRERKKLASDAANAITNAIEKIEAGYVLSESTNQVQTSLGLPAAIKFKSKTVSDLETLREIFLLDADFYDPKGRRSSKSHFQLFVAKALCNAIESGSLSLPPSINNSSDLSRLFNLCCEALGLPKTKNAAYYLSAFMP